MSSPFDTPQSGNPFFPAPGTRSSSRRKTPFHSGQHGLSGYEKQVEAQMAADAAAAKKAPPSLTDTERVALDAGINPESVADQQMLEYTRDTSGKLVRIQTDSGSNGVIKRKGTSLPFDPKTGDPVKLFPDGKAVSVFNLPTAYESKRDGKIYRVAPGYGQKEIGIDPDYKDPADEKEAAKQAKEQADNEEIALKAVESTLENQLTLERAGQAIEAQTTENLLAKQEDEITLGKTALSDLEKRLNEAEANARAYQAGAKEEVEALRPQVEAKRQEVRSKEQAAFKAKDDLRNQKLEQQKQDAVSEHGVAQTKVHLRLAKTLFQKPDSPTPGADVPKVSLLPKSADPARAARDNVVMTGLPAVGAESEIKARKDAAVVEASTRQVPDEVGAKRRSEKIAQLEEQVRRYSETANAPADAAQGRLFARMAKIAQAELDAERAKPAPTRTQVRRNVPQGAGDLGVDQYVWEDPVQQMRDTLGAGEIQDLSPEDAEAQRQALGEAYEQQTGANADSVSRFLDSQRLGRRDLPIMLPTSGEAEGLEAVGMTKAEQEKARKTMKPGEFSTGVEEFEGTQALRQRAVRASKATDEGEDSAQVWSPAQIAAQDAAKAAGKTDIAQTGRHEVAGKVIKADGKPVGTINRDINGVPSISLDRNAGGESVSPSYSNDPFGGVPEYAAPSKAWTAEIERASQKRQDATGKSTTDTGKVYQDPSLTLAGKPLAQVAMEAMLNDPQQAWTLRRLDDDEFQDLRTKLEAADSETDRNAILDELHQNVFGQTGVEFNPRRLFNEGVISLQQARSLHQIVKGDSYKIEDPAQSWQEFMRNEVPRLESDGLPIFGSRARQIAIQQARKEWEAAYRKRNGSKPDFDAVKFNTFAAGIEAPVPLIDSIAGTANEVTQNLLGSVAGMGVGAIRAAYSIGPMVDYAIRGDKALGFAYGDMIPDAERQRLAEQRLNPNHEWTEDDLVLDFQDRFGGGRYILAKDLLRPMTPAEMGLFVDSINNWTSNVMKPGMDYFDPRKESSWARREAGVRAFSGPGGGAPLPVNPATRAKAIKDFEQSLADGTAPTSALVDDFLDTVDRDGDIHPADREKRMDQIMRAAMKYHGFKEGSKEWADHEKLFDASNESSKVAQYLMAYEETHDPAYRELIKVALHNTIENERVTDALEKYGTFNGLIKPSDTAATFRTSFATVQASGADFATEAASSFALAGLGKLMRVGSSMTRTAGRLRRATQVQGKALNSAEQAVQRVLMNTVSRGLAKTSLSTQRAIASIERGFKSFGIPKGATPAMANTINSLKMLPVASAIEGTEEYVTELGNPAKTDASLREATVMGFFGSPVATAQAIATSGLAEGVKNAMHKRSMNRYHDNVAAAWNKANPDNRIDRKRAAAAIALVHPRSKDENESMRATLLAKYQAGEMTKEEAVMQLAILNAQREADLEDAVRVSGEIEQYDDERTKQFLRATAKAMFGAPLSKEDKVALSSAVDEATGLPLTTDAEGGKVWTKEGLAFVQRSAPSLGQVMPDSVEAQIEGLKAAAAESKRQPAKKDSPPSEGQPTPTATEGTQAPMPGGSGGATPVAQPETPATTVDTAANEAATSPTNDKPEPTPAQQKAGNYAKGKVKIGGINISIENPSGSTRSGTDANGKPWSVTMKGHYGYMRRTKGVDGDPIDVFVKEGTPENFKGKAFVISQLDPATGKFDEHKVMVGYANAAEAKAAYLSNYEPGWKGFGGMTETTMGSLKAAIDQGRLKTSPSAGKTAAKAADEQESTETAQIEAETPVQAPDTANAPEAPAPQPSEAPAAQETETWVANTTRGDRVRVELPAGSTQADATRALAQEAARLGKERRGDARNPIRDIRKVERMQEGETQEQGETGLTEQHINQIVTDMGIGLRNADPKARKLLERASAMALAKFRQIMKAGVFDGFKVVITEMDEGNAGIGVSGLRDGNPVIKIDPVAFARSVASQYLSAGSKGAQEWLNAAPEHELLHAVVGTTLKPEEVEAIWNGLTDEFKNDFADTYFRADEESKARLRDNAFYMGNEFIRAVMEGRMKGKITEESFLEAYGIEKFINAIKRVIDALTDMLGIEAITKNADAKKLIEDSIKRIEEAMAVRQPAGRNAATAGETQAMPSPNAYSWLKPDGTFLPVKQQLFGGHAPAYAKETGDKGGNPYEKAFKQGWARVTHFVGKLYAENSLKPLTSKQKAALQDLAIEDDFNAVVMDTGRDQFTVWSQDDQMMAKPAKPQPIGSHMAVKNLVNASIGKMADKLGVDLLFNYSGYSARYIIEGKDGGQRIEMNPGRLAEHTGPAVVAAAREEIIHGAFDKIIRRQGSNYVDFFTKVRNAMTPDQLRAAKALYRSAKLDWNIASEFARMVIQSERYGQLTEPLFRGRAAQQVADVLKEVEMVLKGNAWDADNITRRQITETIDAVRKIMDRTESKKERTIQGMSSPISASLEKIDNLDIEDSGYYDQLAKIIKTDSEKYAKRNGVEMIVAPYRPNGVTTGIEITDLSADEPGKGNGSKAMRFITDLADAAAITVYVRPASSRNRDFYKRFGFDDGRFGVMVHYAPLPEGFQGMSKPAADFIVNKANEAQAAGIAPESLLADDFQESVSTQEASRPALEGLPADVNVPGMGRVKFGPFETARRVAEEYMRNAGLPYNPPRKYAKVDKARAERIAAEFDKMKHEPSNPEVAASYRAMIDETLAQYEAIKATGLKIEPIRQGMEDPYAASPRLAHLDVIENNHLWFFPTDFGFGNDVTGFDPKDNPLFEFTGETINGHKMRANDVFRVVHDYFGHFKEGVGFRADGEENAWRQHSAMYSPLARGAMTSETRGQNSWLNFGPYGEKNRTARTEDTVFADQKIGLMPEWTHTEGATDSDVQAMARPGRDSTPELGLRGGRQTKAQMQKAVRDSIERSKSLFKEALVPEFKRKDGEFVLDDKGNPDPVPVQYDLADSALAKQAMKGRRGEAERIRSYEMALADKLVELFRSVEDQPDVMAGKEWYRVARRKLNAVFGDRTTLFAQLLAATSARTPVKANMEQALDAYNGIFVTDENGNARFDGLAERYALAEAAMAAGELRFIESFGSNKAGDVVTPRTMRDWLDSRGILPRKANGKKYNANSLQVLNVIAGVWREKLGGPKTAQFSDNLTGASMEATIDVWAARTLSRLSNEGMVDRWRILPAHETGVNNEDFRIGQNAFKIAALRLKMNPDDLQGVLWFAEKRHWEKKGWTRAAGAELSDFSSLLDFTVRDAEGNLKLDLREAGGQSMLFSDEQLGNQRPNDPSPGLRAREAGRQAGEAGGAGGPESDSGGGAGVRQGQRRPVPGSGGRRVAAQEEQTLFMPSPERDAEYLRAVEAGDMAAAQRMVDQAAKWAFSNSVVTEPLLSSRERLSDKPLLKVYHGTDAEFREFESGRTGVTDFGFFGVIEHVRSGLFFAENKKFANSFAKSKGGKRIITAFLNIQNPFTEFEANDLWDSNDIGSEDSKMARWYLRLRYQWEAFDGEEGIEFVQWLKSKGYDGAKLTEDNNDSEEAESVWVALDPSQIKSADPVTYDEQGNVIPLSKRFDPTTSDINFMPATAAGFVEPGFYSQLQRVIADKLQDRFDAKQAIGLITKAQTGIKQDEIKWSGIVPWLEAREGKITKQEVLDYLNGEGAVRFNEVMLSNNLPIEVQQATTDLDPKYSEYSTPGGMNYREVVVSGELNETMLPPGVKIIEKDGKFSVIFNDVAKVGEYKTRALAIASQIGNSDYRSRHFTNVPNYVAHYRAQDFFDTSGKPGTLIEEIQSDRHQAGREHGYSEKNLDERIKKAKETLSDYLTQIAGINPDSDPILSDEGIKWLAEGKPLVKSGIYPIFRERDEMQGEPKDFREQWLIDTTEKSKQLAAEVAGLKKMKSGVADAPYRKSWPLMLFKRALRSAVASGMDWIGWTTGAQQQERYGLGSQMQAVRIESRYFRDTGNTLFMLSYQAKGSSAWTTEPGLMDEQRLGEMIGRELAASMAAEAKPSDKLPDILKEVDATGAIWKKDQNNDEKYNAFDRALKEYKAETGKKVTRSGIDLNIGGEGMTAFYDNILPNEIGKYVKQWGGKVQKSSIMTQETPDDSKWMSGDEAMRILGERHKWTELSKGERDSIIQRARAKKYGIKEIDAWRIDITPEMRDSITNDGQTLFMPAPTGRDSATEEENLVAIHNIKTDGILHANKMGGLANPSIAIVRADISAFTGFGDTTLIARKPLVDPQFNKDAHAYSTDIFSPRYPQVEYLIPYKEADRVKGILKAKLEKHFGDKVDFKNEYPMFGSGSMTSQAHLHDSLLIQLLYIMEVDLSKMSQYAKDLIGDTRTTISQNVERLELIKKTDSDAMDGLTDYQSNQRFINAHIFSYVRSAGIRYGAHGIEDSYDKFTRDLDKELKIKTTERILAHMGEYKRHYIPHTLKNASKIMSSKKTVGGEEFTGHVSYWRAMASKRMRSMGEIKARRNSIVTASSMKEIIDRNNKSIADIGAKMSDINASNAWDHSDDIDAYFQRDMKYLRERFNNNSSHHSEDFKELLGMLQEFEKDLAAQDTEYFEVKINRPVHLSEFSTAIIPANKEEDLASIFKKQGVKVVTYGTEQERVKLIKDNAAEDGALFMAAPSSPDSAADEALNAINAELPTDAEIEALRAFRESMGKAKLVPEVAGPRARAPERADVDVANAIYYNNTQAEEMDKWVKDAKRLAKNNEEEVIERIMTNYMEGVGQPTPEIEIAASIISGRLFKRAKMSGDKDQLRKAYAFAYAHRAGRAEVARVMRAMQDVHESPAERMQHTFMELMTMPPARKRLQIEAALSPMAKEKAIRRLEEQIKGLRDRMKQNVREKKASDKNQRDLMEQIKSLQASLEKTKATKDRQQQIEDALTERREAISKALEKEGLSEDDIFITAKDRLAAQESDIVKEAMEGYTPDQQRAIKYLMRGYSHDQVEKLTGIKRAEVASVHQDFRSVKLKAKVAESVKKGRSIIDIVKSGWRKLFGSQSMAMPTDTWDTVAGSGKVGNTVAIEIERQLNVLMPTASAVNRGNMFAQVVEGINGQEITIYTPFDPADFLSVYRIARAISTAESSIYDRWHEYTIAAMLSAFSTHFINVGGNTISGVKNYLLTRPLESLYRVIFGDGTGRSMASRIQSEVKGFGLLVRGIAPGIAEAWLNSRLAFAAEQDPTAHKYLADPLRAQFDKDGNLAKIGSGMKGPAMPGIVGQGLRAPLRLLQAEDAFAKSVIFQMEIAVQAHRLAHLAVRDGIIGNTQAEIDAFVAAEINTPGSQSAHLAMAEASDLTMQSENWVTEIADAAVGFAGNTARIVKSKAIREARKLSEMKGAGELTAMQERKVHALVLATHALLLTDALMRWMVPFLRAPTNILRLGFRQSPMGTIPMTWLILKAIRGGIFKRASTGEPIFTDTDHAMLIKLLAEQTQAWIVMAAIWSVTEGDEDDDEKRVILVGGAPSMSASSGERASRDRKYGGNYTLIVRNEDGTVKYNVPWGRFDPVATSLGITVDTIREIKLSMAGRKKGQEGPSVLSAVTNVMSSLANQFEEKSFFQGYANLMAGLDRLRRGGEGIKEMPEAIIRDIITRHVPNILRNPIRSADDELRSRHKKDPIYDFLPTSKYAEPMRDLYGRVIEKSWTGEAPGGAQAALRMLTMSPKRVLPYERVELVINKWNRDNPQEKYQPSPLREVDYWIYNTDGSRLMLRDRKLMDMFEESVGKETLRLHNAYAEALEIDNLPSNFKTKLDSLKTEARTSIRKTFLENTKDALTSGK